MANKNYDNLYFDILKIGISKLGTGLSFNKLKVLLEERGYDFSNDCIELAVKQWFYDSFHHQGTDELPFTDFSDLEKHVDCNFILKGDSCLTYINQKTAKQNLWIALIALIISVLAILYTIFHDKQKDVIGKQTEQVPVSPIEPKEHLDTVYNIHYHYYLDSVLRKERGHKLPKKSSHKREPLTPRN